MHKAAKITSCILSAMNVFVLGPSALAQDFDALKAGVVKIKANSGQVGTGFIVRVEPEVVSIITAAHVIAGDNQPEVEFFTKRNVPVRGAVLPGAEMNDDIRGLALVVVRGKEQIPERVTTLPFQTSPALVSGGEKVLVIGHPGGGGDWAVVKRDISNRVGRDLTLDPGLASRFSGGPIIVGEKVVGMVMSNRGEFALGITHKSMLNYMEGFGVAPSSVAIVDAKEPASTAKSVVPPAHVTLLSKPSSPSLPQTITGKDGAPMVLVPAGPFAMGSPEGEGGADEYPLHTVDLDGFYIDQYEVTVKRYQQFMKQKSHRQPNYWELVDPRRDAQKPVVGIDWNDAKAYCRWAGKRLPTEAEWEKAARGPEERKYPWGNSDPDSSRTNFDNLFYFWETDLYSNRLKPVGNYEAGESPYGAYDMAGNVWEWVADWYAQFYYLASPKKNPKGPSDGTHRALRGGSWKNGRTILRSAGRFLNNPTNRPESFGVRCAQDAP